MEYKGIKISKDVIIVENSKGQGYVVDKDNNKMLESAKNWASQSHGYWLDGRWVNTEPIVNINEYKNGEFTLTLEDAANGSSQGGKLSFWNCIIKAPDDKEYKIGINSDLLLDLLKETTFINGVCQSKVWLGRVKTNVGVFTKDMQMFKDSFKDEELRNTLKTTTYKKFDVVATLKDECIYCGTMYKYYEAENNINYTRDFIITLYSKPKLVHVFASKFRYSNNGYFIYTDKPEKKPKRIVIGKTEEIDVVATYNQLKDKWEDKSRFMGPTLWNAIDYYQYGFNEKPYTKEELQELLDSFVDTYIPDNKNYNKSRYLLYNKS